MILVAATLCSIPPFKGCKSLKKKVARPPFTGANIFGPGKRGEERSKALSPLKSIVHVC